MQHSLGSIDASWVGTTHSVAHSLVATSLDVPWMPRRSQKAWAASQAQHVVVACWLSQFVVPILPEGLHTKFLK
eukprot:2107214-Amphidinium_carterae.1